MTNTTFISEEVEKQQYLDRFNAAYLVAGSGWKRAMAKANPTFDSYWGKNAMDAISADRKTGRRISLDRLKTVTIALENLVGIDSDLESKPTGLD